MNQKLFASQLPNFITILILLYPLLKNGIRNCKIEALIVVLKSYFICEISMNNAKVTSFPEYINKAISNLNHCEDT